MRLLHGKLLLAVGLVSAAIACSGSPTSPSTSGMSPGATTIRGTARGASVARSSASQVAAHAPTTIRICVSGTTTCADVDGSGDFELTGNFSGDVQLQVTGPQGPLMLTIPNVKRGETIVVVVSVEGTAAAIQIVARSGGDDDEDDEDDDEDDEDGDGETELRGTVSGLDGACPMLRFLLDGATIFTNDSTEFEGRCGAVRNGRRVEVSGVMQTSGEVLATEVEIDD